MKVLISNDGPCANYYIRAGWMNALNAAGLTARMWDIHTVPAFDAFTSFEPDVFIGQTYNIDRAQMKCIKARPRMKVVCTASNWGAGDKDIDPVKYPILFATDEEKKRIELLKKETGKPDFVFIHYDSSDIERTMGRWKDIGVIPMSLLSGADLISYYGSTVVESLKADVGIVSGWWPYKGKNLNKYILPLCEPLGKFKVKIFGNQKWPVGQFCGFLKESTVKDLFRSVMVCPNAYEPHSIDLGFDITERVFKVAAAGGMYVDCGYLKALHRVFGEDTIQYVTSPEQLEDLILSYRNDEERRQKWIYKLQKAVLERHTYFDRMYRILSKLGYNEDAKKLIEAKDAYIRQKTQG